MRLWSRLCARVPEGKAILDIGAYHGDYAALARSVNPLATIAAFEPNRASLEVLETTCRSLGIEVCDMALGDREGCCQFREATSGPMSRVLDARIPLRLAGSQVRDVRQTTVDAWCHSRGVTPALMKIDVEGGEPLVLRGAAKSLAQHKPCIICEVLTDAAGVAVMSVLPERYRFYYIDELGSVAESFVIRRRQFRNRNWLLLPPEAEVTHVALT